MAYGRGARGGEGDWPSEVPPGPSGVAAAAVEMMPTINSIIIGHLQAMEIGPRGPIDRLAIDRVWALEGKISISTTLVR